MNNQTQINCPKCFKTELWKTGDKRLKCKNCHYIFTLKPNLFNVSNKTLNEVVSEFLLEHSTNIILERVNISKYKLLKILTFLRMLMVKDIPDTLHEIIKPDPEDLKPNNKTKKSVIGIFCKEEKVYTKILPNIKDEDLKLFLKAQKDRKESLNHHIEEWQRYVGLAFKKRFYRIVPPQSKKYRIDALETFWGYLKRKLSSKGGVRKEKLPLYLGEYAWRYNHKKLTLKEQEEKIWKLLIANR